MLYIYFQVMHAVPNVILPDYFQINLQLPHKSIRFLDRVGNKNDILCV